MAYVKKPLKAKIASYKSDENKKPVTLTYAPLIDDTYLHLLVSGDGDLKIDGVRLAVGYKGFIICSCLPNTVGKLFDFGHITEGKPDTKLDESYLKTWQDKGCLCIIDPSGNESLELLSTYDKFFFDLSEFNALTKITEEHKQALTNLFQWQLDNNAINFDESYDGYSEFTELWGKELLYPSLYLCEEDFSPKRGAKIKHPPYNGTLPLITLCDIKLPDKGVKSTKGGYGTRPSFLSTEQRLQEALSLLDSPDFLRLYNAYIDNPTKVIFALNLTGLSIPLVISESQPIIDNPSQDNSDSIDYEDLKLKLQSPIFVKEFNHTESEYNPVLFSALNKLKNSNQNLTQDETEILTLLHSLTKLTTLERKDKVTIKGITEKNLVNWGIEEYNKVIEALTPKELAF